MNEIDLRYIDLNLLVAFQTVMAERHVGRAAIRLALTQSAVSHALTRLRHLLNDPLFVRHPKGVEPTARALSLAPRIADILERARAVFAAASDFNPTTPRHFSIATVDLTMPTIVIPLIEHLRLNAPAIDLRILPLDRRQVVAAFDRQEIDVAIMNFRDPPARIKRRPVLTDRFVGIARRGHPEVKKGAMSREVFARLTHLLVSLRGDPSGLLDAPFPKLDVMKRRVAVTVPHVLAALQIVATTDLVTLTFERVARRFEDSLNLTLFEPPTAIPEFTVDLLISAARAEEPALPWLAEQIAHVCAA
jgi:DNA-binding transcriptional LysR family regulator